MRRKKPSFERAANFAAKNGIPLHEVYLHQPTHVGPHQFSKALGAYFASKVKRNA
jgi:hypothetical protein